MNKRELEREILSRKRLSVGMLREKSDMLERQIDAIEAHQCNTFGEGTDGWKEMDAILAEKNSEFREVRNQISFGVYGHLGIAQIAAWWDESSYIGRARMLKDLPPYTDFVVGIMDAYLDFKDKKWDDLEADIVAEFREFARDGKSTEAADE